MKRILTILFLLFAQAAWGATYYVDNTCTNNGNGTATTCAAGSGQAGPFNSIANMQAKSGGFSGDDTISFKCGQTYRELFTLPSSGTSGHPIVYDRYGTCTGTNNPIIKGSNVFSGWSAYGAGLGSTWQVSTSAAVLYVWMNGSNMTLGGSATTLTNHQWFYASNVLYFREDAGNPDTLSEVVEATANRGNCIKETSARNYLTFNNITLMHSDSYAFRLGIAGSTGVTLNNVKIYQTYAVTELTSVSAFTVNNSWFEESYYGTSSFVIDGSAQTIGTINNSIFYNLNGAGIYSTNTGTGSTLAVNNSLFYASAVENVYNTGTSAITVKNTILSSPNIRAGSYNLRNTSTGSITFVNCAILPQGIFGSTYFNLNATDGGNNLYVPGIFVKARYPALATFGSDDSANFDDYDTITSYANARRIYTSQAISHPGNPLIVTPTMWTHINTYAAAGNEICNHTQDHADLTLWSGLTIHYTGAGTTATMDINVAGHYLKTYVNGSLDINIDLSSIYEMDNIVTSINGHTGYTAALTNTTQQYTNYQNFADVSGVDIKTATYTAAFDSTRYFDYMETGGKASIEANMPGYTVNCFVYPDGLLSNGNTAAVKAGVLARGFNEGRGLDTGSFKFSSIDLYNTGANQVSDKILNTSTTITKQNVWALLEWASQTGSWYQFFSHGKDGYTQAVWQDIIDAVAAYQDAGLVQVMTPTQAINWIKAHGTTSDGGATYQVPLIASPDFHFRQGNALCTAGTTGGPSTDIEGKNIINQHIGPYTCRPVTGIAAF